MRMWGSCGEVRTPRTTRFGMAGSPLGGVHTDEAKDEASEEKFFRMVKGEERTSSGVRGVRGVG